MYAFWHKRLQHSTNKATKRIVLPKVTYMSIADVVKSPPCAPCIFDIAHKIAWKSKGGSSKRIDKGDGKHGDGISCNHIISNQSGLIS